MGNHYKFLGAGTGFGRTGRKKTRGFHCVYRMDTDVDPPIVVEKLINESQQRRARSVAGKSVCRVKTQNLKPIAVERWHWLETNRKIRRRVKIRILNHETRFERDRATIVGRQHSFRLISAFRLIFAVCFDGNRAIRTRLVLLVGNPCPTDWFFFLLFSCWKSASVKCLAETVVEHENGLVRIHRG